MINRPLDQVVKADVDALVDNAVQESKTIEYKLTLPESADAGKREFLADVCSFANAMGGDVIFGIEEAEGAPVEARGLTEFNEDEQRLRLESTIRDGISPRIPGVQMKAVAGFDKGPVVIMRVPRSWCGPHMVSFKGSSRFYGRSSAGKFQMDVAELRHSFAQAEELPERMRRWRDERIGRVMVNDCPVLIDPTAKLILHLIPFDSFSNELRLSVREMLDVECIPLGAGGWSGRINVDGTVTFDGPYDGARASLSYCQIYRSGRIEAVKAEIVSEHEGKRFIRSIAYEQQVLSGVEQYLKVMRQLGVSMPIAVFLTITGAKGAHMGVGREFRGRQAPIDRDPLLVPEVLIDGYEADITRVLQPAFDSVWNAAGIPHSLNYDETGKWKPRSG